MVASILEIGISRNVNCDNMVGFPKSGHIYRTTKSLRHARHAGKAPQPCYLEERKQLGYRLASVEYYSNESRSSTTWYKGQSYYIPVKVM